MYKITNMLGRRVGLPANGEGVILNIGETIEVSNVKHDEFMKVTRTQAFASSGAIVIEKVEEPPVTGWDER